MSLWQYLAESYDKNSDTLKANYPLSATSISNKNEWIAVIVIDSNGNFIKARKIEKEKKEKAKKDSKTKQDIIPFTFLNIPVTERSAGRTGKRAWENPHPVFDKYDYIKESGKSFDIYEAQLKAFADSPFATSQVKAIRAYISKKTIEADLDELEPNLNPNTNVVFEVQIPGNPQTKVWEDSHFFEAWHEYYLFTKKKRIDEKRKANERLSKKEKLTKDERKKLKELAESREESSLDLITGKTRLLAISHPKKIANTSANAKLVSDNDTSNFTFRGRFETSGQAVSIGYESSQKAHQFLRYLVNDRGVACGEQVVLSFTVGSTENTLPPPLDDTKSILDFIEKNAGPKTQVDEQISFRASTGSDYADALRRSLTGSRYGELMEHHARTAVLALDAPISGRMSVTFYRELARKEYLERIAEWHEDCKWNQVFWQEEDGKWISIPFIGAPSVDQIIETAFGRPRSFNDEGYTKVKKAARERLLRCIFDGVFLPTDYVISAISRASNPLAITRNDKFDRNGFGQILSTACALVRKDFKQRKMEDYILSLEPGRTDRDYLYGRLLGAADKLEEYVLYKNEKDRMVTAAIRHMQTFSQHPFRTWETIHNCLLPYIQKVKGGFAFQEIGAVKNLFRASDFENDAPLNGSYLLAYYHERAYIDQLVTEAKAKKQAALENPSSTNESENNHEPDEQN